MKVRKVLILAVLGAGGAVLLWLQWGVVRPTSRHLNGMSAEQKTNARAGAMLERAQNTNATSITRFTGSAKPFDWRLVESEDYRKYIANLRAIGCPEETIRDIVMGDLKKLFEMRARELKRSAKRHEYWRPDGSPFDPETMQKLKELTKERQAACKALIGVDMPGSLSEVSLQDQIDHHLAFVPEDKLKRFSEAFLEYNRKRAEAEEGNDKEQVRRLREEWQSALSVLFTPEERLEVDLRLSPTTAYMLAHLGDFGATEQEFPDIFRLRKRYDDEFGPGGAAWGSADFTERSQAALKELNGGLRNLLGEERYHEYAFEKEWSSTGLRNMAKQFDISKAMWMQVFDARTVAQEQADGVRQNSALTPAQRQAALDGIRAETENAIGGVIGHDLLPGYMRLDPWMEKLNAPTR